MENKYSTLARDTLLFGISNFLSKIMIFILLPICTSFMSTSDYGKADVIVNLVNLLYPLITLSIVEALMRFAFSKNLKRNELIGSAISIILLGGILFISFTPLVYVHMKSIYEEWIYFVVLFSGYSLYTMFSSYCRGTNRTVLFAVQGIVQTVSMFIFILIFLICFGMGKNGYLLAICCSYFLTIIFIIIKGKIYVDIVPIKVNFRLLREMLNYSIPLIPSMMAWWLNNSADKYVIIAFEGLGASGIYATAHKVPTILTTVTDVFNQAFFISAVNSVEENDKCEYFKIIMKYFLIVLFFVSSILIICSEIMASILFAKDYHEGWVYIPALLIAAIFSSLSAILASLFRANKKTNILFISTLIGALINVLMNIVLIRCLGIAGVTIATAFSFFVVFIIRYVFISRIYNFEIINLKNICSTMLIIVQAYIMCSPNEYRYLWAVIVLGIIGAMFCNELKSVFVKMYMKIKDRG